MFKFFSAIVYAFFQHMSLFTIIVLPVSVSIIIIVLYIKNKEYKSGAYYQATKLHYLAVRRNLGRYGEYLTYKYLKHMEATGAKFLFNIYIPKDHGETTEIDVLMLCSKGIFVFESKNYSGWIFGSELQKNWYQTLPNGKGKSHKEHFYNPIMQNRSHIKHLKILLGEQFPMRSIIVFSDRCTLKSVQINSDDIHVINRYDVASVVYAICNQTAADILSEENITELYNRLFPFTQIDETTKAQHITNIHRKLTRQSAGTKIPNSTPPVDAPSQTERDNHVTGTQTEADSAVIETVSKDTQSPTEKLDKQIAVESTHNKKEIPKCPRCNSNLVLRTATKGSYAGNQFYGCSNYPKCKHTQNITNDKTV